MFPPTLKNMTSTSAALYTRPIPCNHFTRHQKETGSWLRKWQLTVVSSLSKSVPTAVVVPTAVAAPPENKQIFPEFPLSKPPDGEGELEQAPGNKTQISGPTASAARPPVSTAIGPTPAPETTPVDMATPGTLNALSVLLSALNQVTVNYQTYFTESPTAASGLATAAATTVTVSEFPTSSFESVVNSFISSALSSVPIVPSLPASSPSFSVVVNTALTSPTLSATQPPATVPQSTNPLTVPSPPSSSLPPSSALPPPATSVPGTTLSTVAAPSSSAPILPPTTSELSTPPTSLLPSSPSLPTTSVPPTTLPIMPTSTTTTTTITPPLTPSSTTIPPSLTSSSAPPTTPSTSSTFSTETTSSTTLTTRKSSSTTLSSSEPSSSEAATSTTTQRPSETRAPPVPVAGAPAALAPPALLLWCGVAAAAAVVSVGV
ncbi:hypothetical protein IWX46DRAFT_578086 [Phyllosticta citricarpa]|uniref:Uncharacterized protein n=1 Tax=Phyllosticta citricarpa TaxID=55181 RepID=A0ABR1MM47_9PEZI